MKDFEVTHFSKWPLSSKGSSLSDLYFRNDQTRSHFSKILISSKWSIFEGTNFPEWSISKSAIFEKGLKIWINPFFWSDPYFWNDQIRSDPYLRSNIWNHFSKKPLFSGNSIQKLLIFWSDPFFEVSFRFNRYWRVFDFGNSLFFELASIFEVIEIAVTFFRNHKILTVRSDLYFLSDPDIVSRSSLGLKSILKMPGLEPGTSRLSMPMRVRLPSALHPRWPERTRTLYRRPVLAGLPAYNFFLCSFWGINSRYRICHSSFFSC